jgi:hypothetical protein
VSGPLNSSDQVSTQPGSVASPLTEPSVPGVPPVPEALPVVLPPAPPVAFPPAPLAPPVAFPPTPAVLPAPTAVPLEHPGAKIAGETKQLVARIRERCHGERIAFP